MKRYLVGLDVSVIDVGAEELRAHVEETGERSHEELMLGAKAVGVIAVEVEASSFDEAINLALIKVLERRGGHEFG